MVKREGGDVRGVGMLRDNHVSFRVSEWQFYEVLYSGQVRLSHPSGSFMRCQAQARCAGRTSIWQSAPHTPQQQFT